MSKKKPFPLHRPEQGRRNRRPHCKRALRACCGSSRCEPVLRARRESTLGVCVESPRCEPARRHALRACAASPRCGVTSPHCEFAPSPLNASLRREPAHGAGAASPGFALAHYLVLERFGAPVLRHLRASVLCYFGAVYYMILCDVDRCYSVRSYQTIYDKCYMY